MWDDCNAYPSNTYQVIKDEVAPGVAKWLRGQGSKLAMGRGEMAAELCDYAAKGDIESIKLLTSCGCDVQSGDYDSRTCLHLAASVGNAQITHHLLDCGADVNSKDRWGGTPLADAIREGHLELAKVRDGRSHGARGGGCCTPSRAAPSLSRP